MTARARSSLVPVALAALASLAACGCGSRSYGRGLRRLAPFGVRVGWVDFGDFEFVEAEDRPLAGLYLRTAVKGRAVIELAADAAFDMDAADERLFYSGGVSVLYFPTEYGGVYLHAGGGAMSEATPLHDYVDAYAAFGAGYSAPVGPTRLDLRASVWRMIDSANVTRAVVFTMGYGF